jgi:septal ring factor EnvC (AmiA/AmiB activator)
MEKISIALLCTVLGVVISYLTFQRNKDNSIRAETKENAFTSAKLDYISKGVDDIRLDIKAQDRKIEDIADKVARIDESTKSAHKRIDRLERNEE